jgi:hypothetical protein
MKDYFETKEAIEKLLEGFSYQSISNMLRQIDNTVKRNSKFVTPQEPS